MDTTKEFYLTELDELDNMAHGGLAGIPHMRSGGFRTHRSRRNVVKARPRTSWQQSQFNKTKKLLDSGRYKYKANRPRAQAGVGHLGSKAANMYRAQSNAARMNRPMFVGRDPTGAKKQINRARQTRANNAARRTMNTYRQQFQPSNAREGALSRLLPRGNNVSAQMRQQKRLEAQERAFAAQRAAAAKNAARARGMQQPMQQPVDNVSKTMNIAGVSKQLEQDRLYGNRQKPMHDPAAGGSGFGVTRPMPGSGQQQPQQGGAPQMGGLNMAGAATPAYQPQQQAEYNPIGDPLSELVASFADGGEVMHPAGEVDFYSEGGMNNRYVRGAGDGTSDDVPAMLAAGEFVIPADVVASLGNGDNKAGAEDLDRFMEVVRQHKTSNGDKGLPPDSKGALSYIKIAQRKA